MTTANKLTLLRVFLIPVFMIVLYLGFPGSNYVALAIFVIASLTDFVDGYIARSRNEVTDFGKFMDPLADKLLVCTALVHATGDDARLGGAHRAGAGACRHRFAAAGRGGRQGHCRRLVRQGEDGLHHGVHHHYVLPCSASGLGDLHRCDRGYHRILRRGVFCQEQGCSAF